MARSNDCTATLEVGDSCNVIVSFGPTTQDTTVGAHTGELDVAYNAATGNPTTLVVPLNGNITGRAAIQYSITASSGFAGGQGSSLSPFSVNDDIDSATVTITFANAGLGEADGFSIDASTLPAPWSLQQTTCTNATLAANLGTGSSCDATFVITGWSGDGEADLDIGSFVTASWTDGTGANTAQTIDGFNVVFVVVVQPAVISFTVDNFGDNSSDVVPYATLHVIVTLTGGLQVPDQVIDVADIVPQSNNINAGTSSCTVNSTSPSCEIDFALNDSDPGAYSITFANESDVALVTSLLDFNIVAVKRLFVTAAQFTGNLGGFLGANTKCTTDDNNPNDGATFDALLTGNGATTDGTVYANFDGLILGTASGGNPPATLLNPVSTASGIFTWTGASGHTCSTWTSSVHSGTIIGDEGLASAVDGNWFDDHTQFCNQSDVHLYCVEQ